ncbi:hypothetical protein BVG79_01615 [Ketogulonicigenium robustum]|uniref:PIN domain-containing protein n=1 Tax=Ketogulonicigenium robustum TaxID=92947 RepID=A0A1W6P0I6_9RHOB|nr:PIN domain-containing protein [Ketogulonicigenium robustum]ARO14959.1 hypothetical protein BVG79_01615 [Ketogulonicigenium robustum]
MTPPRIVIDACVLFPTVMREVTVGAAAAGLFRPVWSDRILGEWQRAVVKLGPAAALQAEGEIAMLRAAFPQATVNTPPEMIERLYLPDPNDRHVLATAIASSADAIVTMNAADFPKNILAEEGVDRLDPDGFLLGLAVRAPDVMVAVVQKVLDRANQLAPPGGAPWRLRALMKRARLNRLGKLLDP